MGETELSSVITPAMIEAGIFALLDCGYGSEFFDTTTREAVIQVLEAALSERRKPGLFERMGRIQQEFERCRQLNLPPPLLSDLDRVCEDGNGQE